MSESEHGNRRERENIAFEITAAIFNALCQRFNRSRIIKLVHRFKFIINS